jgi:hypothetical protein
MLHSVTVSKQRRATKIERDRQERFPVSPDEQVLMCKHTNCKSDRFEVAVKTHLGHEIGSRPEKDDEKE